MAGSRGGRDATFRDMGSGDGGALRSASTLALLLVIGAVIVPATASSAEARPRHRSHAVARPVAKPQPHSYYPENVQGGVPGNLPFNNQIRKLTDPLNANGAGH